ncbi:hypothetical protein H8M03_05575 [Sphingomonas sabuli]|uniref:DUF5672 domain-containing protein n=1 Tax=Sphingomonas sabuli TaxID=2764186 RepID=A0A7G9L591_9SPHN|nr:DUF5672 family protein [Sphingomonas sabuli]QNM83790.1 hypothetical protein H8M03_05575 [Sphingomonas sabuli]
MDRLALPEVTLCAATSVNIEATLAALVSSMEQVVFGKVLIFTHQPPRDLPEGIDFVAIPRLGSSAEYSSFILEGLGQHIETPHCLVVQWDGFVLDAAHWDPDFLTYDYIGAPWPQFGDGHDVGNGGFSLRSQRLFDACRDPAFDATLAEDVAIGRVNRHLLEQDHGIRIAARSVAARFSFERGEPDGPTFGFHGVFNMIPLLGSDRFWRTYESLDDRGTVFVDYRLLMQQLGKGRHSAARRARLTADYLKTIARRRKAPQA